RSHHRARDQQSARGCHQHHLSLQDGRHRSARRPAPPPDSGRGTRARCTDRSTDPRLLPRHHAPWRDRSQRHVARYRRALLPQAGDEAPRLPHAHPARPSSLRPAGEVRQVFSNLFVNAIEASENTELTIRACGRIFKGRPGISCLIADRGTGVQPAVRERLFSPFITSKHSLGTVLGLWVTRGIVEKHGGTILYRTRTEPPSGTIFRVFL